MKKRISLLLAVCMLAAFMAATVSADNRTLTADISAPDDTVNADVVFPAGTVPAQAELTEAILPPVNALVLSMVEHELAYDTTSPHFVWNALFYALSLYGTDDDRAQLTDEALILPLECVEDFTRALFADLAALPPLPAQMDGFMSYDAVADVYRLSLGDFAPTETQLTALTPLGDGLYAAEGTLTALDDGYLLCTFRAVLRENDTMFGFSLVDVSLN